MLKMENIRNKLEELAGKELIDGCFLESKVLPIEPYYNGCDPQRKVIYLSFVWRLTPFRGKSFWNSLLCAIGHERTHIDIYNIETEIKNKIKEYEHGYDERKSIRSANWLKEEFCDIYGARRAGRTKEDLIIRIKKYSCTGIFDSDKYPSMKNRTKFAGYEEFNENLITEIANKIYGEGIIPEKTILSILELFDRRINGA